MRLTVSVTGADMAELCKDLTWLGSAFPTPVLRQAQEEKEGIFATCC